ncbi:MAG: universal stress protein [Treponema sp.]|nr:universal stress protein [Treponema sp.]
MFQRIIVPLDGSASAEAALPAAALLARRLGSSIVLLHVVEARPPKEVHGERHLAAAAEAEAYLGPIAERLRAEGLDVKAHVHLDGKTDVAGEVAAHEAEFGNDLAVMVAHGEHGHADILSGSIPLKVAAAGGAAVLMVPASDAAAVSLPRRILLPLDGREEHEVSIPAAETLARIFGASVALVAAVPKRSADATGAGRIIARLAPALSGASLEYAADGAATYLARVAERLKAAGVEAGWSVARGRPAKVVSAAAEAGDLVVLSTHRRMGLDASMDGCVAFSVALSWHGAMLIVPVPRA